MNRLLILALFPCLIASWKTKFDFFATLKCDRGGVWCADLWYQELDPISNEDYGRVSQFCTELPKVTSRHVEYDATDGMFNNYFELDVTISHNCTSSGFKNLTHRLPDVSIFETYAKVEFELNLTD